jgi:hypothetical protein
MAVLYPGGGNGHKRKNRKLQIDLGLNLPWIGDMAKPARNTESDIKLPPASDWRTSDADELNRRRLRARTESFTIVNTDARHPVFSNFSVQSGSGMTYQVEVRDLRERQTACDCVDYRINGLGACKHTEAVLLHLEGRFRRLHAAATRDGSTRIEVGVDQPSATLKVTHRLPDLPASLRRLFDGEGRLIDGTPEEAVAELERGLAKCPALRISQEVKPWLESRRQATERRELRHQYELKVQSGEWPAHETLVPLFPYQREGMLHLAFTERALLADEMGLGKTIQAIAACALLHRLGLARRVLVVTPASLKTEWEDQIQRFTQLPYQLVFGGPKQRREVYDAPVFFTIVNYEQMMKDALDVNSRLRPDVIVLDEAQRIKNWSIKTTQAIKRLRSRYAFVLTGTPIENRLDELYSLMDFLNPSLLGPLFRFNREYYAFDERGRPAAFRNLEQLHQRIAPYMLRRRKEQVETELPDRTDRNHFIQLTPGQVASYQFHQQAVAKLMGAAARRPLSKQEQDKLMRELAMMRMICDTNYILDPEDRECPKLQELGKILEECRQNPGVKVIIFSEWERMLELVKELCERMRLGFAWHTGSVPQRRRRGEINAFKTDPQCRVFLSTDSGATGLNLQNASVVVNCDLPWNPAKLEQRIARAWRKYQTRPVTVVNLVAENTIEHRMLDTLANKRALADGVLDLRGDLDTIKLRGGSQAFLERLKQLITPGHTTQGAQPPAPKKVLPADRGLGFAQEARQRINGALVRCEERYPQTGVHSVIYLVVERDAATWQDRLADLYQEYFVTNSDPLAPVRLEVVDQATDAALQRLMDAGLIATTQRASRSLSAEATAPAIPRTLNPEEQAKLAHCLSAAERKTRMARLLGEGGLADEAREALFEASLQIGRALAVNNRLPEPGSINEALAAPLSFCWGNDLTVLRQFIASLAADWRPLQVALDQRTQLLRTGILF